MIIYVTCPFIEKDKSDFDSHGTFETWWLTINIGWYQAGILLQTHENTTTVDLPTVPYCACDFAAALERQEEKHQGRHGHQQIDGIGIFQQGEIGKHRQPQLLLEASIEQVRNTSNSYGTLPTQWGPKSCPSHGYDMIWPWDFDGP